MAADVLVGFTWSRDAARYRDSSTGRFVARRDIIGLLETQTSSAEHRLGEMVTALHEGRIDASTWQVTMRDELRRLHSANAALGVGGWDRMTFSQWGREGQLLRGDYQRLTDLAQGIANGEVSLPQALNRVNGYIGNARTNFFNADRDAAARTGRVYEEIRRLGSSEHCDGCIEYAAMGYQPLGILPVPGDGSTECGTHCRCTMERREVTASEQ